MYKIQKTYNNKTTHLMKKINKEITRSKEKRKRKNTFYLSKKKTDFLKEIVKKTRSRRRLNNVKNKQTLHKTIKTY